MKIFDDWYTDNFIKDHNHVPTPGMRAMLETGWNAGQKSVLEMLPDEDEIEEYCKPISKDGWPVAVSIAQGDAIAWFRDHITKAISEGEK